MMFDPFELDEDVTPKAAKMHIRNSNYYLALSMALRLNEPDLIRQVMEQIPVNEVSKRRSFSLVMGWILPSGGMSTRSPGFEYP